MPATATYDDQLGRVRISATGFSSAVVSASVTYRLDQETATYTLRGASSIPVSGGALTLPADDYEFAPGQMTRYSVIGRDADGTPVAGQTQSVVRTDDLGRIWLKFLAAPYLNQKLTVTGWGDVSRRSRHGVFQVAARRDPVVVTDLHSSRSVRVDTRAADIAATDELDESLSLGAVLLLHTPADCPLPTMYAVAGDYSFERAATRSKASRFRIALTECARPASSIVGSSATWSTLLNRYATWQAVLDAHPTWASVVELIGDGEDIVVTV